MWALFTLNISLCLTLCVSLDSFIGNIVLLVVIQRQSQVGVVIQRLGKVRVAVPEPPLSATVPYCSPVRAEDESVK